MRFIVQASVFIEAEPNRVFKFLSSLDRHRLWITGLTYVSESGPLQEGLRYESKNSALGVELPGRHLVLRVERGKMVELENIHGPLVSVIRYVVSPVDRGCMVTCVFEATTQHMVFGLAAPVVESLAQSRIEADLGNLKALVEADRRQGELRFD